MEGAGGIDLAALKSSGSYAARLAAIKTLVRSGDPGPAEELCEVVLAAKPDDAEALILKGEILMGRGDLDAALACIDSALKQELGRAWALRVRGQLCAAQGDHGAAEESFREAIRIDPSPDAAWSHLGLGKLYRAMGDDARAIASFEQALLLAPGAPAVLFELERARHPEQEHLEAGAVLLRQGRFDLAEKEFREAVRIKPSAEAWRTLIGIYKKQKQVDLCVEANSRYLELEETEERARNLALERRLAGLAKDPRQGGAFRVKIIKAPYFEPPVGRDYNYSLLLPLGLGQITAYLRANDLPIEQDDLYVKINHDNLFGRAEDRIDPEVFRDEKRVLAYAGGKPDPGLESVLEKVEAKTGLAGYSAILLSLGGDVAKFGAALFVLALARYLKVKYAPFIMVGGLDGELDALARYDTRHIDFIGRGKGERLLFAVLTALKYGVSIGEEAGLPVIIEGKTLRAPQDCALGPASDYDGLPLQLYRYRDPRGAGGAPAELAAVIRGCDEGEVSVASYQAMEGCFYGCIFCNASAGREIFILSPKQAVARLRGLRERHGLRYFYFLHPLINISRAYTAEFCDEIVRSKLDILWSDCARADNLDRDLLLKMREAGCVRLIYGVETASPRLLKYIDKRIGLERLEDILRWSDEAGIMNGLEIICGFPGETEEDLRLTADLINRNRERLDFVYCNILYIEKQSKLCLSPEKYGIRFRAPAPPDAAFAYDEIGGLRWEERREYMRRAYGVLSELIKTVNLDVSFYENEPLMFHLYSRFRDKRKVVSLFREMARAKNS